MKPNRTKRIIVALAVIIIAAAIFIPSYLDKHRANLTEDITLYIKDSSATVEDLNFMFTGKIRSFNSLARVAEKNGLDGAIKAGRYVFPKGANNIEIVRALKFGWESPFNLTLSGNIRGIERLCSILGKKMMYDSAAFSQYFNSPETWEKYNTDKANFMSLFIPNTYQVYWSYTPEEFTERMKREYEKFWNGERDRKAKALGLTREEVLTLASIVCEESNHAPELPAIAGVYINRLKRGMKLDADPTVKYALADPSIKRILYRHLTIDSPYNTYKYNGLPPGPITIPQISGIDAVLDYQKHDYLYFCASEKLDGTHKFAKSQAEHNANARKYQRAISSLGIR